MINLKRVVDAIVNGQEADWKTVRHQHVAFGKGGGLIAGNPKVFGSKFANKKSSSNNIKQQNVVKEIKKNKEGLGKVKLSKKQANVIYANGKNGNLRIKKWLSKLIYDASDYVGYDDLLLEWYSEISEKSKEIINNIFSKNFKEAQKLIDELEKENESYKSKKIGNEFL